MKTALLAASLGLAALAGFAGCAKIESTGGGADSATTDESGMVRYEHDYGVSGDSVTGAAHYALALPEADRITGVGALAESLRAAIAWAAAEGQAGPDGRPLPVDTLAARFVARYEEFKAQFPDAKQEWSIERRISLETLPFGIATIKIDDERYEGGAHGSATTFYQSYEPASGARMRLGDVADAAGLDSLRVLGEAAFRKEREVPPDSSLASAGFFEWDPDGASGFRLSDNFGVTRAGLVFQYNAYDVAAYAAGPTTITLPWPAVSRHVRADGPLKMAK